MKQQGSQIVKSQNLRTPCILFFKVLTFKQVNGLVSSCLTSCNIFSATNFPPFLSLRARYPLFSGLKQMFEESLLFNSVFGAFFRLDSLDFKGPKQDPMKKAKIAPIVRVRRQNFSHSLSSLPSSHSVIPLHGIAQTLNQKKK